MKKQMLSQEDICTTMFTAALFAIVKVVSQKDKDHYNILTHIYGI